MDHKFIDEKNASKIRATSQPANQSIENNKIGK
jgi:hypothetical protein